MVLSKKRITKALFRLRRCAGWFASLLFVYPRRQVISHRGPYGLCLRPCILCYTWNTFFFTSSFPSSTDSMVLIFCNGIVPFNLPRFYKRKKILLAFSLNFYLSQFQQCGACDQQSLWSACPFRQSDQSLCSLLDILWVLSYWPNIFWRF